MSLFPFSRKLSACATRSRASKDIGGVADVGALDVERRDGIIGLQALAGELDAVNQGAEKPSPFATSAFTIAYASNSERDPLGMDVRVFVVRDGAGLALGWAVFAFRVDELLDVAVSALQSYRILGKLGSGAARIGRAPRLELMTTSDVDRPGIVALAGCEEMVAKTLLGHLIERELDWTLLEWRAQECGSSLWRAAHDVANPFLRVRDVELDPYSEVRLQWPDVEAYFRALSKRMRSNVSRQARKLYASGDVGLIMVDGSAATAAFFDAYEELESRSWKHHSCAAMGRHPLRRKFYSCIVSGRAGIEPSMIGVSLDGVLIAALINGRFGDRMWSMEMAFDESCNELGPGQLLLLLAVMDGLQKHCRSLNFFQLHGYFKRRWLADELPVVNVQMLRRPSLHDVRGLLGDAHRWTKAYFERRAKPSENGNSQGEEAEPGRGGNGSDDRARSVESRHVGLGVSEGFNATKREVNSARRSESSVANGEQSATNAPVLAENLKSQRALLTVAIDRALGIDGANAANVRTFDVASASVMLPFTVR